MKKFFDFYRIARRVTEQKTLSYIPQRGARFNVSLKWVCPERKRSYEPVCSGDLVPMKVYDQNSPFLCFEKSKELETADEKVKKIFSVSYQIPHTTYKMYQKELVDQVKNNSYDTSSLEARIAKLTAYIRYCQKIIPKKPKRYGKKRKFVTEAITKRRKHLKKLRSRDYKKFEWLLETLNIEYKPPPLMNTAPTREKSLTLLAKLKMEKAKEEKLARLKKSFDEQKVPFFEKKIEKLKEIKAKEEKYNLPVTVTDEDIQECIKKLEEVKIQVAERAKRGYVRKIHPYFLEPYDKDLLLEKEKAGEKIREELIRQKQTAENHC